MAEDPYGHDSGRGEEKAANPFVRDILVSLAASVFLAAAIWLYRKYHLYERWSEYEQIVKLFGALAVALFVRYLFGMFRSIRHYFEYRSYVKEFRNGRPMSKENYLKEQEMVKREYYGPKK